RDRSVGWDGGIVAHDWHIARSIPETLWPMHIKEQTPMTDMQRPLNLTVFIGTRQAMRAACCRDERRIIIV
ncbi:MAG: hypothetical protein WAL14_17590, partial [Pseudolabrys sp.]